MGNSKALVEIHTEYYRIMHDMESGAKRDQALAALMTRMESDFHIPALQNPEWESKNRPVISLYRIISESRGL